MLQRNKLEPFQQEIFNPSLTFGWKVESSNSLIENIMQGCKMFASEKRSRLLRWIITGSQRSFIGLAVGCWIIQGRLVSDYFVALRQSS